MTAESVGSYLGKAAEVGLLSPPDERALAERVRRGDAEARRQMIEANLLLVAKVAGEFKGRGVPFEDLVSEGNLGLFRAVERFDPSLGNRFSTYAAPWIRKFMREALRKQGGVVRLPENVSDKLSALLRARHRLAKLQGGRPPTIAELAAHTAQSIDEVSKLLLDCAGVKSLDAKISHEDESTLLDYLGDQHLAQDVEEEDEAPRELARWVSRLSDRERDVLERLYGKVGATSNKRQRERVTKDPQQIAAELGLSVERFSEIHAAAIAHLRGMAAHAAHGSTEKYPG